MEEEKKFFIDAYWAGEPEASGRDANCLWFHAGKKSRVRKGDHVLVYETKRHPDHTELHGSGKVFKSARVTSDLIKTENLPKVGDRSWEYCMKLTTQVRVDRDKGIDWQKVRQILGLKPGATLRNPPLEIEESHFLQIESELKRVAGIGDQILEIASDERDEVIQDNLDKWFTEGGKTIRTHVAYERNRGLVIQAKKDLIRKYGKLFCDICKVSLEDKYGDLGKKIIDMHHVVPVSELDAKMPIRTSDLIPVCPTCHRIIHSIKPSLAIDKVRQSLKK